MFKKRRKKKSIAIEDSDCSITRRPKNLQQLIHQNYTGLPGCTPVFDNGGGGVNLVERQRQLHACTHGIGVSEADLCALSEAENVVFLKRKSCNIYGEYKQKFRSGDE